MHYHYIKKCDRCFTVIEQCRCMDAYKTLIWDRCDNCKTPNLEQWTLDPKETKPNRTEG